MGGGKEVVVLGGGLAGLCSAYELKKRGYTIVAILEAQTRTGGRVLTLREGVKNNQYIEYGATRIADSHKLTLAYASEFKLALREFESSPSSLYYLKGGSFIHTEGSAWPAFLNLSAADRSKGADSLVLGYEKLEELGDPLQASWPTGKALSYDQLGLLDYLRANGASDDVLLIDKAINGSELDRDGALYWLMADVVDATWDKTFAIAGGNDLLPKAFTSALGDVIKYGCKVTGISQDASGVTVTYESSGVSRTIAASLAVCSLPFSTLRKVKFAPVLSPEKARVVQELQMMPVSRAYMQTKTRFWQQKGIGGLKVCRTDTPVERLWDMTQVQDGDSGILLSYMQSDNGVAFAAQPEAQRADYVKNHVAKFLPEITTQLDGFFSKVWQDDPWCGGAWGYYKPGEMGAMFPAAKRREGRVFFCGEHTSAWSGWMQGAFESALRVVNEIAAG